MGLGLVAPVALAASAAVLGVTCCVLLARGARQRRLLADDLAASREELAMVQRRLDTLARQVDGASRPVTRDRDEPDYVITTAGLVRDAEREAGLPVPAEPPVSARQFASVALGESLVTLVSLGYGVRRALSAENRNRIGFEMRREVRRARKERKRELKEARRHLRAAQRSEVDAA